MRSMHLIYNVAQCFVRYKIGRPTPFYVAYELTYRCNLQCKFCNIWRIRDHKELSLEQAKEIVDKVAKAGVPVFNLSGGEPLLRRDLEDIALYARSKGMLTQLGTNGVLLTRERAKNIAKVFDVVNVSLDGFEETHDRLRGVKGTFKKAVKGIENLINVKGDCIVGLASVLLKENYQELIPLFREAKSWGVDFVCVQPVMGAEFFSKYSVSSREISDFTEEILREKTGDYTFITPWENFLKFMPKFVKGEMPRICDAGRLYLVVGSQGQVSICPALPRSKIYEIGSLMNSSLTEILNSERAEKALELTKNCSCCALCTTAFSLIFRTPLIGLAKQALKYYKLF